MMIYLASASPRRRTILRQMKILFRVVSSSYEEKHEPRFRPEHLVMRHAEGKARKAKVPAAARWVVGSDTLVWCRGRSLGKPRNESEARKMLRLISGKTHQVFTGIAIWDRKTQRVLVDFDRTDVTVKKLSEKEITNYLVKTHPYDKAGAYGIQTHPKIVSGISGSYSNVVGFPRVLFRRMLKTAMVPGTIK